jgi:deoxyribose-phosphate aldolase
VSVGDSTFQSGSTPSSVSSLASRIQSTLVSNQLTHTLWEEHLQQCLEYRFHAALIPAAWVRKTADALRNTGIRVASFVDLPYGTMSSAGKAYEAGRIVDDGGEEVDLMPNVGFLLSDMKREYREDIRGVVQVAQGRPVKVMLELPLLNEVQRKYAVDLSIEAGASYLKNASSGAVGVATAEQIRFLRRVAPAQVRIKASGGIKKAGQVWELLEAGADLVGTTAGVQIMREIQGEKATLRQREAGY